MSVAPWIMLLGAVVVFGAIVPNVVQIARSVRSRTADGWDRNLAFGWCSSYLAWAVYSGTEHEWGLVLANAVGVVAMGLIVVLLGRAGAFGWRFAAGWTVWTVALVVVGVLVFPPVLAVATTVVDAVMLIPQTRTLLAASSADGVSAGYLALWAAIGVGMIVYSWGVGKPLLALFHYVGTPWAVWAVARVRSLQRSEASVR